MKKQNKNIINAALETIDEHGDVLNLLFSNQDAMSDVIAERVGVIDALVDRIKDLEDMIASLNTRLIGLEIAGSTHTLEPCIQYPPYRPWNQYPIIYGNISTGSPIKCPESFTISSNGTFGTCNCNTTAKKD